VTRALRRRHRAAIALLGVAALAGVALALAVRPILPPLATGELPPARNVARAAGGKVSER